jgi:hypothetical protein
MPEHYQTDPEAPLSMMDAVQRADGGDRLELDLIEGGFYGPMGQMIGLDDPAARAEWAERSLGDFLVRLREEAVERRWGVDENTMLNMAFRMGHHYVEADKARRAVVPIPAPRDAVRRTFQKFEPWYRQQHSRLSSGMPDYHLKPKTRQQADRDAADYADELAEWRTSSLYSLDNRGDAAMWKLLAGNVVVFAGVEWTPDPRYMIDPMSGAPLHRPDIVEQVFAPQETWCDDRVSRISKMRWFGVDRFVPIAEALATYPEQREKIEPEITSTERGLNTLRAMQRLTRPDDPWHTGHGVSGGALDVEEESETILCEFWLKQGSHLAVAYLDGLDPGKVPFEVVDDGDGVRVPIVHFPEGLRVVFTTNGDVLEVTTNIYGVLPFREMRFSKSPGYYGYAPATPLRQIAMAINWIASMRETHALKVGNAPMLEPREARVRRRGLITSALAKVTYRSRPGSNTKPEYLQPPPMMADLAAFETRLEMVWQDIAGLHEVSQAKLPSADLSGVTVSLLLEQDLSQLGYAGEEQEAAFIDLLKMELLWIQKFFPSSDPRLVQLAGDAMYKLEAFMAADLENGLDIQVVKGSSLPKSPAAVEAKAKEAWQLGFMVDEHGRPDFRRMQSIFGLGSEDALYAEEEIDEQNARLLEDLILSLRPEQSFGVLQHYAMAGRLPPPLTPQPEDDAMVFERNHRLRLKRLQQDPRSDPMTTEVLRLRWQHYAEIVAMLDPAVAASLMQPAAPGEEGGQESGGQQGQDAGAGDAAAA